MTVPTLHHYQRYAAEFVKEHKFSGLFLDMGLGKTLITLTALSELGRDGKLSGNVLIIAPKLIAINTWPAEVQKWDHTKNAKFTVLSGLKKPKRDKILIDIPVKKAQFYVCNPELLPGLVTYFGQSWPFQNVVVDEVQTFKSYDAIRFKALMKVRSQIERVIILTGTPAPSSLMDIWPQITLLDAGQRLGENITAFRENFFHPGRLTPQGYPYEWLLKNGAEDFIYKQISDIVISMKAADYLKMPKVTYNNVVVAMTSKERVVYDQLKKDKVIDLLDGEKITSANAAVLSAQLLQLANGAIYMNKETRDIAVLHDRKMDALEQIIDSSQGEPILVFYWFQHDIKRIIAKFGSAVTVFDGTPKQIADWNNKKISVLICHPASAGFGLNLQDGGHIVVWFSLPNYNLGLYQQSNARIFRQGQTKPVIIHHIVTTGTVDTLMLQRLDEKAVNQESLIDAVKRELTP